MWTKLQNKTLQEQIIHLKCFYMHLNCIILIFNPMLSYLVGFLNRITSSIFQNIIVRIATPRRPTSDTPSNHLREVYLVTNTIKDFFKDSKASTFMMVNCFDNLNAEEMFGEILR